jgi:PAS domain S-box-containing protein
MTTNTESGLVKDSGPPPWAANDIKLASLWVTFRNIQAVVVLILVFAVIQMVMLRRVCDTGMATSDSLEHQGLPYLDQLGNLREHLALFRLYSYEYLFARESEQEGKKKAVETVAVEIHQELQSMEKLLPSYEGGVLVTNLEASFDDLNHEFGLVRSLVNSNFAGAMQKLDGDIPEKLQKTIAAANAVENYGYHMSAQRANATFGSFGWIKENAVVFGSANAVISLGAWLFVILVARRTRVQISDTMSQLKERSDELSDSLSLQHATLDSTADAIVAVDQRNRLLCFNQKFVKLWGFSDTMLQRKRTDELMTLCSIQTTEPEQFLGQLEKGRAVANAESFEIEFKDGRMLECFANPQRINQQSTGVVLSFRDVTGRKRAEAELKQERDLLRALMDNSGDCIYFKDAESRFTRCSANMVKAFHKHGVEELTGRRDSDFFSEEHASEALADEQNIIRTGESVVDKVEKETWPDGSVTWALTSKMPLRNKDGTIIGTFGISKNISALKEAEAKINQIHQQLLSASRQAGMAEIATSVLHNVGNVLNSVNVSSSLIADKVRNSKVSNLPKIVAILRANENDLGNFFTNDPKGKQLVEYLPKLAGLLTQERDEIVHEAGLLVTNVVHIKEIVSMQQNYARSSGILERVDVRELVQDAVRMNNGAMNRHNVNLTCQFDEAPPILTEKHKVLQILVNLIRNAKYACDDSGRNDKQIIMRVVNGNGRVKISVTDNGVGIPAENLTRIFNHGFTTRKEGHGFGLHSGANAARELGGSLVAASDGRNRGATFTLELPVKKSDL